MPDTYQVTYQLAPRKRRLTLLVTDDRAEAESALRRSRKGLLIRWRAGRRVEVRDRIDEPTEIESLADREVPPS